MREVQENIVDDVDKLVEMKSRPIYQQYINIFYITHLC